MDPLSALGIAASVVQFVDFGYKLVKRLSEYTSISTKDVPRSLQSINIRLPLLLTSLSRVKSNAEVDQLDFDTKCILRGVLSGCSTLITQIDEVLDRISKQPGESFTSKLKKAFASFKADVVIASLDQDLQMYIHLLVLHHVVEQSDWNKVKLGSYGSDHFVVKPMLTGSRSRIKRQKLLDRLHSITAGVALVDNPLYLELYGPAGCGKTQLALQYAYDAHKAKHYQSVFWLDASSYDILSLGLQHVAEIVYNTKILDKDEKLRLVKEFFESSVNPWLLVLDNCHKDSLPPGLLPINGYGTIMLTTREPLRSDARAIRVPKILTLEQQIGIREKLKDAISEKNLDFIQQALLSDLDINAEIDPHYRYKYVQHAAKCGYIEGMLKFLDRGADPTDLISTVAHEESLTLLVAYLDWEDRTSYHADSKSYASAAKFIMADGDVERVALLLKRRPAIIDDMLSNDSIWYGGINSAAEGGHLAIFKLLKSNEKLPNGGFLDRALCQAVCFGHTELIEFLVDSGASLSGEYGDNQSTPLMCAVQPWSTTDSEVRDRIVSYLLEKGSDAVLNLPNKFDGTTPLTKALRLRKMSTVKMLLAHGADPSIPDHSGENSLENAIDRSIVEAYDLLTALDGSKYQDYYVKGLFYAAKKGNRDIILKIWDKINDKNILNKNGCTALSVAIREQRAPAALLMLRKGADVTVQDKDQMTPWLLAVQNGMHQLIEWMANKYPSTLEARGPKGNTALMLAMKANKKKSHDKTIEVLIKAGVDEEAVNDYGETAREIAESVDDRDHQSGGGRVT